MDANNQPITQYVIHELLHVVFHEMTIGLDETMEEVIIVSLDHDLYEYVKKSKHRTQQWHKLIERKLDESNTGLPTPHEELVDRSGND